MNDLHLYEEIMLLALRDQEGTPGGWYHHAVGGAILAELLASGRLRLEDDVVHPADTRPARDPLLDECFDTIRAAKRPARLAHWMAKFAGLPGLKRRAVEGLLRRGILRADEDKVLLIFEREIFPEIDPAPERELKERIRDAVLSDTAQVDPETAVLIALAHRTGLLGVAFERQELKGRDKRIERIMSGNATGKAAKEAIESMQAAFLLLTVMPAVLH